MTVDQGADSLVDAVIVTFNNADSIRSCVEPLSALQWVNVVVVDNASDDGCLRMLDDLRVEQIALDRNTGFASGCNTGWRDGSAPYVLFLNPDARIDEASVRCLVEALERQHAADAAGPRIVGETGELQFSQRRFPRLVSTYARALFLHHVFPRAPWADEVVRDGAMYLTRGEPEWISGACILIRRSALERLDGWDRDFFMYSEDADLCRRLWNHDGRVVFVPDAEATHAGGMSAPRDALLHELAWSRVLYARKHCPTSVADLQRAGIALESAVRVLVTRGGRARRAGHARAFRRVCTGSSTRRGRVGSTEREAEVL